MKNLTRFEKGAVCLTLLIFVFTAGFFLGRSTATTTLTFSPDLTPLQGERGALQGERGALTGAEANSPAPAAESAGIPAPETGAQDTPQAPEAPSDSGEEEKPSSGPSGLVNINTATQAELEALPGIGPALAQRIIEHRQQHGPFADKADIMDVKGIGQGRYNAIRDLITTGG